MKYLLTFACFGSHLPGRDEGIVSRKHNRLVDPFVERKPALAAACLRAMEQRAYLLDRESAQVVLSALIETCAFRGWHVYAIHARTNHVHVVLEGDEKPERMLNDLKAYASRKLNALKVDEVGTKRWARHGSTRYLWDERSLAAAIRYVLDDQGEPMAVWPS